MFLLEVYDIYRNDPAVNLSFHLKELEWGGETDGIFFFPFPYAKEFCWRQGITYHNELGFV